MYELCDERLSRIEQRGTTIDYIELCDDTQVIFLGQKVANEPVRDHLCQNAAALKEAGVTHFAIEFNKMPSSSDYERLCDELNAHGIKIILADVDQRRTPDGERREAYMTKCIVDILKDEPTANVAALFSSFHAGRYIIRIGSERVNESGRSQNESLLFDRETPRALRMAGLGVFNFLRLSSGEAVLDNYAKVTRRVAHPCLFPG